MNSKTCNISAIACPGSFRPGILFKTGKGFWSDSDESSCGRLKIIPPYSGVFTPRPVTIVRYDIRRKFCNCDTYRKKLLTFSNLWYFFKNNSLGVSGYEKNSQTKLAICLWSRYTLLEHWVYSIPRHITFYVIILHF